MTKVRSSPAYARFDSAHLFDGLFVPTNGKKRVRLDVPAKQYGQHVVAFRGYEQLGADDQSIMLAISAQLGIDGLVISNDATGEISKKLRAGIELKGDATGDLASKETSIRSLLIDAGYKDVESGSAFKRVKESLERLRMAHVVEVDQKTKWNRDARLLVSHFNEETGQTYIAVNPRLTSAIFSGQHVKVSLFERNSLESEVAKILHGWLCSNVRLGKALGRGNGADLDTLAPHVWGPHHDMESSKVKSTRRGKLRDALDEIGHCTKHLHGSKGWEIEVTGLGIVLINRPEKLPLIEQHGKLPSMLELKLVP